MRLSYLVPLLAAFVAPTLLPAAEPSVPQPTPTPARDEQVVVTADRRETDAIRSTASVAQRDAQDDRERGYVLNTWQWLEGIAGVDAVGGSGGIDGGIGRVRIRGANSYDTQWLVDGIPVSDPSTPQGNLPTYALPSAGLDRVEVVRGPQSGLYGSRAVGGVVNLITARPTQDHEQLVRAEAGSFGTVRGVAEATGPVSKELGYAVSVDGTHSDGYSAYTDADSSGDPKDHERDGIDRLGATGRMEWQALPATSLYLAARYLALNQEFDNYNPDDRESSNKLRSTALSAGSRSRVAERVSIDTDLSWVGSERTYHTTSDTVYDGDQYRAAIVARYQALTWLEAALGGDGGRESITTTTASSEIDHHDWLGGIWGQLYSATEHHDVSLSVRQDAQSHAGDATTYRIAGAAHAFERRATLRAAVGTAFRAPSLSELYGYGANTELEAQKSLGWEVGVRLRPVPELAFESTYFVNDYDNVIDYVDPDGWSGPLDGRYTNIPDYRVHGIENTLTIDLWERHLSLQGNYTWQKVDEIPVSDYDIYTVYLPRHLAGVALVGRHDLGWARLGYTYRGTSPTGTGEEKLDAASVVDAAIGATITRIWEASVRVENLFDDHYEVNSSYTTSGLAIYGGVAARF
jgi:vitamin B12 transporter